MLGEEYHYDLIERSSAVIDVEFHVACDASCLSVEISKKQTFFRVVCEHVARSTSIGKHELLMLRGVMCETHSDVAKQTFFRGVCEHVSRMRFDPPCRQLLEGE